MTHLQAAWLGAALGGATFAVYLAQMFL